MEAYRKNSVNYGVMLGIALILIVAVMYVIDVNLMTSGWIGGLTFILVVAVSTISAVNAKKILGGFMSFKEAFVSFFLTMLIGFVLYTIFSILLLNVIDPEAKEVVTDNVIKTTVDMMQGIGAKSDMIEETVAEMQKSDPFGPMGQLQGLLTNIVIYSIIGLIVALIVKRERPQSL